MFEKEKPEDVWNEYPNHDERFEWLMEEYGQSVIRLAYTYVKQKQLAEDIAQDVFIKCYQKMNTFRNESSYKTWIFRITVNRCKDVMKSWAYKNVLFTDFVISKINPTHQSTESELMIYEEKRFISEKIISLPVQLREVIILYYYEGFTTVEISALLSLNENTIKSRLFRARRQLRKMLEGGYPIGKDSSKLEGEDG